MSAHDHDHHDHADHGHDHGHDDVVAGPLPPTPSHGFWKSMRELDGTAAWQVAPTAKEFPVGADQAPNDPLSRRNFFHLMGASMGLAGLGAAAGCQRYEKEEIVPLARRPEDQVPGTTLQYATTFELGGSAHALVATSYEGRPIHVDGNADHPFASGGIVQGTQRHAGAHTFAQAAILHLYDPDRSQTPLRNGSGASFEAFRAALVELRASFAAGTARVLSEATSSPTVQALQRKLAGMNVSWHEYEPLSWDNERDGTKAAFERPLRPIAKLDQCETIVAIDCDLFVEHPAAMRYSRDFAKSRRLEGGSLPKGKMNRLWSVESAFSNTGAMADHRLPLRSELCLPFVMALDAAVGGGGAAPNAEFLKGGKVPQFLATLAEELMANRGRAVVVAGRRQPPAVHALVARINHTLGAVGATLDYVEDPDPGRKHHLDSIKDLVRDINAKQVKTLIILGGNPVYDAPADLDFAGALAGVQTSIHLSEYADETSKKCTWHLPRAHFLEAWGDARTWDGTISLTQPLIAPLFGGLSSIELLSLLLGDEHAGMTVIKDTHENVLKIGAWRANVEAGFIPGTQLPSAQVAPKALPPIDLKPSQLAAAKVGNGELEVAFLQSSFTYDGRYANNAWLWETPDFLTKVTWDNYALVSPETAQKLSVDNDTMITVKVGDKSVELPCYVMPGQALGSIGLVLGGGRTAAGHVGGREGKKSVGYDTYKVRATTGWDYASGCSVTGGGRKYELASTQDHWSYKPGAKAPLQNTGAGFDHEVEKRSSELIKTVTAAKLATDRGWKAEEPVEFWDDAETGAPKPRHLSLFEEHTYEGHRWAMSIDLSTCTGCNSCMVACQSENNVPVVGRREVINNREMSWIRIDRYFQGDPDDPQVVYQPLGCQQCENAPCEQVCPVGATQHTDEGLNDMSYNRCIGTRYCANNCPYKVRRFNFLDWNKEFRDARNKIRRLLFNPDVTVRMRGVMEKCTYCVQRIQNAKIRAKAEIRNGTRTGDITAPLPDGSIETACQMACPTEAIVFGDLQDPNSRVSKLHELDGNRGDARSYGLLPETYTKPRTRYLARVRNPNTKLEKPGAAEAHEAGQ